MYLIEVNPSQVEQGSIASSDLGAEVTFSSRRSTKYLTRHTSWLTIDTTTHNDIHAYAHIPQRRTQTHITKNIS
jgi:hypothetical protein